MPDQPKKIYLKDYKPPVFTIDTTHFTFEIEDEQTMVTNISTYKRNSKSKDASSTLVLNGREMELLSIEIDGEPVDKSRYEVTDMTLKITNVPENFTLKTVVKIKPHENKQLAGLYKSDGIFCTQNEPEGFRRISYHLDRSDVLSIFTTTIIADSKKYPVLLSNGNLVKSEEKNGKLHNTWKDPIPKPCYLFALVAGDLQHKEDSFTTMSGKVIPLQIFTEAKDIKRVDHAMESLKLAMKWDEERFGREYDLDLYMIVAVDAFNAGAMENKGLNIFNTAAILADPQIATDANYKYIERVIAHEYFHNWTGDRITCRDWFQLTLKEGLTVFRDAEFTSDLHDRDVKIIQDSSYMRESQFAEDSSPMAHPIKPDSFIQIENFYTRTVYEKGSEVIRMLLTFLGRETFRKGMDTYFKLFDGQAVTTEDFIFAIEQGSGRDFTQFRDSWYTQAGTPVVTFSGKFDEQLKTYSLTLTQDCPYPKKKNLKAYHFPLMMGLLDEQGNDMELIVGGKKITNGMVEVKEFSETFIFENITEEPVPSLLRDFSAPINLQGDFSLKNDIFLFQHDSNLFNRYEAGQRIARRLITEMMKGQRDDIPEEVLLAYRKNLLDENLSQAIRSQMFSLPSLFPLVQPFDVYEYKQAFVAKREYAQVLANFLEADLLSLYNQLDTGELYSKEMKQMDRRSLKNTCLCFLSVSDKKYTDLIYSQYKAADNMTDTMCALTLLQKYDTPEKREATQSFYEKWKKNPLVMNKWFAIQASASSEDVLETVKKLKENPAFDFENPNKIRALFGSFGRNYPFFHDESGAAYEFMAEQTLAIDTFNGKVAGSLAQMFNQYKHLPPKLRSLLKPHLENIRNTKGISDILFEVVNAILEEKEV